MVGPAPLSTAASGEPVSGSRRAAGGRYILGDLLGRGGMAEVFAGRALGSLGFQKPVAIKRLLPSLARDEEFVGRLVDEAKLLVGLQHANVISVLDLVRDGDDVFLVMEFVDGPSVRQLLGAHRGAGLGPLPLALATYIAQLACAGLEYAHARPTGAIVHADISPSNLLLTTSGEVKVADFGIARPEGIATAVEGKWAYMPPEQARGEVLTARSDEFALGVCLYELLTGVHPFARRVSEHGRDESALREVRPLRELRPEIPPALEAVCLRAMAADPAARFPRLQHLHDALSEIRFSMGWRDGAGELAALIRELQGMARPAPPDALAMVAMAAAGKTQHTAAPITILTRSLIGAVESDPHLPALPVLPGAPPYGEHGGVGMTTPHAWTVNHRRPPRARRPRWMSGAAILGAALVAGVVAAVVIAQGGHDDLAPPMAAAPAAPLVPTAGPSVDEAPRDPAALAPPAATATPTATATIAAAATAQPAAPATTSKPRPTRRGARPEPRVAADPRPADPRPADPRPAPAADVGTLQVQATPWAFVTVDGKRYEAPATIRLAPGSYNVVFTNPDLNAKATRFVTVRAGKKASLRVNLSSP